MRGAAAVHRFALAAAVVTFLLLAVGGVVTSRDAGMIFLDWPLSNGSLNPDGWLHDADQLSEHGHRILGAAVGLLLLVTAFLIQRRESRRFVRVLGWSAVGAVVAQGVLGGLRVRLVSTELALIHGCAGQIFFALVVALAYFTSPAGRRAPERGPDAHGLFVCAAATLFAITGQMVLGAHLRHIGGPLHSHLLGAILVSGSVLWTITWALLVHGGRPALQRPAFALGVLLTVQVVLGLAANQAILHGRSSDPSLWQYLLPSAHQATGALMVGTATLLLLAAARRRHESARAGEWVAT